MEKINDLLLKTKKLIDKYWHICLFIIFAVFLFSRLFRLASLPYGIHVDEQGAVLDGYYLSHYGYDRNMWHMPPHLMNYINGQSSLYAYSVALVLKFLPFSIFSVRLPAVLWGCVGFFFIYALVKDLFDGDKAIALLGPVFFTITPFIFSSERWGLDCNLYLPLAIVTLFFFIRAMKSAEWKYYIIAGFVMGFTLYTYALSYVVTVFFILATFAYMLYLKRFELKKWIAMGIPCFLFALPLILFNMVNMELIPEFNLLGMDIKKMVVYRGDEVSLENILKNIAFIPHLLIGYDGELTYNAFDHTIAYGTVYIFMVPVIIAGLVWLTKDVIKTFKKKEFDGFAFIWMFFICSLVVLMLVSGLSINNANQMYFTFIIFAIYLIEKVTKKWYIFTPIILAASAIFFAAYSRFYFCDQKDTYGYILYFYGTQAYEIVNYAEKTYNPNGDKTVYFEEQYEDQGAEVFLLSALKDVPPWEFDEERTEFRNVKLHLPEVYDDNEPAIYIMGSTWDFAASALVEIGYNVDVSYENYYILYR